MYFGLRFVDLTMLMIQKGKKKEEEKFDVEHGQSSRYAGCGYIQVNYQQELQAQEFFLLFFL